MDYKGNMNARNHTEARTGNGRSGFGLDGPCLGAGNCAALHGEPHEFGVQDFCANCSVCMNNCPGDAIPKEHVMTHGIKRWLIDLGKCYPYSRLRDEYCHLCVDVCPYNVQSHPETFKNFMKERKQVGYKTPKSW